MFIQHIVRRARLFILLLPYILIIQPASAQNKQEILQLLWQGLGGQEAWQEARFFMFSCTNSLQTTLVGEHSYIWDRVSGNCRFEGVNKESQKLTVLFNTQKKTGKVFVDNKIVHNADSSRKLLQLVLNSFYSDAFWLFPPNLINVPNLDLKDEALIGAKKYYVVEASPPSPEFGEYPSQLYIDTRTGYITKWRALAPDGSIIYNFVAADHKDVGGGLILATSFVDRDSGATINYSIVSALINVESEKFNKP